jgi:hypothetical protein
MAFKPGRGSTSFEKRVRSAATAAYNLVNEKGCAEAKKWRDENRYKRPQTWMNAFSDKVDKMCPADLGKRRRRAPRKKR